MQNERTIRIQYTDSSGQEQDIGPYCSPDAAEIAKAELKAAGATLISSYVSYADPVRSGIYSLECDDYLTDGDC